MLIAALGFTAGVGTASRIAWERWGTPPDVIVHQPPPVDLRPIEARLAALSEENRLLRAELDGIAGPGGVLPRIVERLQVARQESAAHRAAIQQLLSEPEATNGFDAAPQDTGARPVQVTPVRVPEEEASRTVIVTPSAAAPTEGPGDGG
jgi:hypothetical protein